MGGVDPDDSNEADQFRELLRDVLRFYEGQLLVGFPQDGQESQVGLSLSRAILAIKRNQEYCYSCGRKTDFRGLERGPS